MANDAFGFQIVDQYYHQYYIEGEWQSPEFKSSSKINIAMSATSLHYGQQVFEGMKAFRRKDGGIQLFRPLENAKRFRMSCRRMMMPEISDDQFMYAVTETVKRNAKFLPEYDLLKSLYIRPFMIGIGHNLGLRPAPDYFFGVFVAPVGMYLKGDLAGKFLIVDDDRAADDEHEFWTVAEDEQVNLGFVVGCVTWSVKMVHFMCIAPTERRRVLYCARSERWRLGATLALRALAALLATYPNHPTTA